METTENTAPVVKFMYTATINGNNEVTVVECAFTKLGKVFCQVDKSTFEAMTPEMVSDPDNWARIVQPDGENFRGEAKAAAKAGLHPTAGQAVFALLTDLNAELRDLKTSVRALRDQTEAVKEYRKRFLPAKPAADAVPVAA